MARVFVDTDVLAYLFDDRDATKQARAEEALRRGDDLVLTAARTASEHQLSIWDAMVVEAARLGGCTELWTEDLQTGGEIRGAQIVNPLA